MSSDAITAIAFAAIGLFVWGAYRYRVNRLSELERLRTRPAADLHDEIGGNLSSIAMFGKIIQDQETSPGENPLARSQLLERIVVLSQESVTAIREIIRERHHGECDHQNLRIVQMAVWRARLSRDSRKPWRLRAPARGRRSGTFSASCASQKICLLCGVTKKSKHRATLLCLFFWLNFAASLFAQRRDIRFEHISVEQGLSHFTITAIVQDHQGFLWFGTEHGLNRYDGHNFTVYKPNPSDTHSLPHPAITSLCVDHQGNFWVGTGGGLCRYNPDTDKFIRYPHDPNNPNSLSGDAVNTIFEDSMGKLWIGTHAGLNRYDSENNLFIHYRHDPNDTTSLSSDGISSIIEDRTGTLWIGTYTAGLNQYERKNNTFVHYRHDANNPSGLSSDGITCILEDRRDVIWIGTNAGLNRYDPTTDKIVRCRYDPKDPYTIAPDFICSLYEDSKGVLWVGTFGIGLLRYDPNTDRFFRYVHDPDNHYSLEQNRVDCIYEDRSGVLWIGTYRGGLNRYDRKQDVFIRYKVDDEVYAVFQDRQGKLWIGTGSAGLQRHDRQSNRFIQYLHDPKNPESLSHNYVPAIHEDSRGELWIGTNWSLNRFDARRQRFVRYHHEPIDPKNPEHHEVKAIYEDAGGELWIGTKGSGLCRLNRRQKTFTYYRYDPDNSKSLSGNNVWSIHEDKNGDLWIGTFGSGVNRFDKKTQTFTRYQHDPKNPHSLNNNAVYTVYADTSMHVWIGTYGGGLNRYDPTTGVFTHYTERDGLPDNFVKGILPDGQGNLWLSTEKGVSKFNPQTRTFKNYTEKDGLHDNIFLSGAFYKSKDGRFYFGGRHGVTAFHPDSIKVHPHVPPVVITSFKVFDKPLPQKRALFSLEEIELSYRQNFFSFEFVALDYTAPAKNQYVYKLEGFDPDWIHAGARRYASYTNVDPGAYIFRVKGANSDEVWNEQGAALKIVITPPFWQTWWFRILAFAAIGLLVWSAYRYRVNRLLEMERLRTRLSADLHDEIAGNLSSIAMFGKIIQDEEISLSENPPARSQLLERIIALSQESVTAIREIIWAIDPQPETIHDLLLRLHDLAVNACRAQNMTLKFDAPPREQLPPRNLSPEQRKHLWLLLKEAINNAIKHSGGTELAIYASYKTGHLHISIIDNGSGLDGANSAARFSGKGLGTMKARAEQLNGSFGMFSDESGTTVNVTIKL